ncbi:glycoside hydrolase family 79 protein, partial [Mycena floridula]
ADVTIYYAPGQKPFGTGTAAAAAQTSLIPGKSYAVLNTTELPPPAPPNPLPSMQFDITLQSSGTPGLSINQQAGFLGFSVEMSVANQILGKNSRSTLIQVPFLNLMSALIERSGRVNVRVGGNTQEQAALVDSLPDGRMLSKGDRSQASNPTATPPIIYTLDLLILMREISNLLNVRWYLGAPFNDTSHLKLDIIEHGQAILGDYLLGMQVGNEPDLFNVGQRARPSEIQTFITGVNNDAAITNKSMLMGPSVSGNGNFTEQQVWDAGFIQPDILNSMSHLTVEHYQDNNCALFFAGIGPLRDPQDLFPNFLKHSAGKSVIQPFINTPNAIAVPNKKPYIMMETNTASCGGFPGISDSFGAALWGIDYSMQLAYSNFSGAMMHVGGLTAFYNVRISSATNESSFHGWSVGPIYYSTLVMAEAMGPTNASQILDLKANNNSDFTPAYAIYENGVPARIALFNYIDDPSGASTYSATVSINGGSPLSQVKVKYLTAPSVSTKYNFTWAGQTFGGVYESDGRIKGDLDVKTVTCNGGNCVIQVPAPSFALVFLSEQAFSGSDTGTTVTFPTTVFTKTLNTATVDASILATSNGH